MDDLDILFSRIEQLELPPGTREIHLARIARATVDEPGFTTVADPSVDVPVRRRHTTAAAPPVRRGHGIAAVLTGAAVVAIVAGAWFLFAPEQDPVAPPLTQPTGSSSTPTTVAGKTLNGSNLLTSDASATELAGILHISQAAARAGLARLAAQADQATGLDPASDGFRAIAADLGTTPAALQQALISIKAHAGGLGIGPATTQYVGPKSIGTASAGPDLLTAPNSAAKLAAILHISTSDAQAGLARLATLAQQAGHLDPTDARFVTIATDLGTTPSALIDALGRLKAAAAGNVAPGDVVNSSAGQKLPPPPGQSDLLTAPGTASRLATLLHISPSAAKTGLARLAALADQVAPTSPNFQRIATDMGTTPDALAQALKQLKAGN